MIKALSKYFSCYSREENIPTFSIDVSRYDSENEVYMDIKNVDINIGVTKYTTHYIISACNSRLQNDIETKKLLEFFLNKFLSKNKVKDSVIYITVNGTNIRVRNTTLQTSTVLRLSVNK